jgi:hypothetical protein
LAHSIANIRPLPILSRVIYLSAVGQYFGVKMIPSLATAGTDSTPIDRQWIRFVDRVALACLVLAFGLPIALNAQGSGLTIATTSLPAGTLGATYVTMLSGTGGSGHYHWTGTGMPPGLIGSDLDRVTDIGMLSGVPTKAGTYTINLVLQDTNGDITRHD